MLYHLVENQQEIRVKQVAHSAVLSRQLEISLDYIR